MCDSTGKIPKAHENAITCIILSETWILKLHIKINPDIKISKLLKTCNKWYKCWLNVENRC